MSRDEVTASVKAVRRAVSQWSEAVKAGAAALGDEDTPPAAVVEALKRCTRRIAAAEAAVGASLSVVQGDTELFMCVADVHARLELDLQTKETVVRAVEARADGYDLALFASVWEGACFTEAEPLKRVNERLREKNR